MATPTPQQLAVFSMMYQHFCNTCIDDALEVVEPFYLIEQREGHDGICDTLRHLIQENKLMELYEDESNGTEVTYDRCGEVLELYITNNK